MTKTLIVRMSCALAVGALGIGLTACGDSQDVTSSSSTTVTESPAASTSPPVVGGPKPKSPTSTSHHTSASHENSSKSCGTVPGPDGALKVTILAGDITCADAKPVADQYAPKIATGQQQTVDGWTCAASELEGVLAACQKDRAVIGFAP